MPINLLCPFYWEYEYYITFCKLLDTVLAQDIAYAVFLSRYIIVAPGYPNTEFVSIELTSPCILSAHSAKRPKRRIWLDENVIPNSKSKGPDVKKWPQRGLYFRKEQSSIFWSLSTEIVHIPNHYCSITSYVYSGLLVLGIPSRVETKSGILCKQDFLLIFLSFSCFQLWIWSLLVSKRLMIKCNICNAVPSSVFFLYFSQNFCN